MSASPSTASSARSSSGTLPSATTRAGRRCSLGRSTTTWNEALAERPSPCPPCWLVSSEEVSPSTATTTPLAARSTLPRAITSTRTLWRRAFWTTLPLSLLATAGSARRASAAATVRKINVPPLEVPWDQQYRHRCGFPKPGGRQRQECGGRFPLLGFPRVPQGQLDAHHRARFLRGTPPGEPRSHPAAPSHRGGPRPLVGGVRGLGGAAPGRRAGRGPPPLRAARAAAARGGEGRGPGAGGAAPRHGAAASHLGGGGGGGARSEEPPSQSPAAGGGGFGGRGSRAARRALAPHPREPGARHRTPLRAFASGAARP